MLPHLTERIPVSTDILSVAMEAETIGINGLDRGLDMCTHVPMEALTTEISEKPGCQRRKVFRRETSCRGEDCYCEGNSVKEMKVAMDESLSCRQPTLWKDGPRYEMQATLEGREAAIGCVETVKDRTGEESCRGEETPSSILKPSILKPSILKPSILKPSILKPSILKPSILKPPSTFPHRAASRASRQALMRALT
jgi:hypothetical protein